MTDPLAKIPASASNGEFDHEEQPHGGLPQAGRACAGSQGEAAFYGEMPLQDVAYLYDGSLEGLLTAVFTAYERHEHPGDIATEAEYAPRLGQSASYIETDAAKALRVKAGLERAPGKGHFKAVLRAFLSSSPDRGSAIYEFIRLVMEREHMPHSGRLLSDLSNPVVARVADLERSVLNEAEKMRQFVRFEHLENGVWFAVCNPTASVLPLVVDHFVSRFNDQPFLIYDENHELSIMYDGDGWQLVEGPVSKVAEATDHDRYMQEAWRCFYDSLCIDARYSPELRRNFMPVKYWKNLTEMKPHRTALKKQ